MRSEVASRLAGAGSSRTIDAAVAATAAPIGRVRVRHDQRQYGKSTYGLAKLLRLAILVARSRPDHNVLDEGYPVRATTSGNGSS
jgi:hypothetical protein